MSETIVLPTQVYQLTILKVVMLVLMKDQQLLCPAYVQPEQAVTVIDNTFNIALRSIIYFMVGF